jgi:long-chain-fatty-acid--CoA ligase ACSBG
LKKSTVDYFASLDMPLLNAYGLSETTSGMTMQTSDKFNLVAAGYAFEGVELRIFNPDEAGIGEICMRGRNIMRGYFKNEAATIEVIDN